MSTSHEMWVPTACTLPTPEQPLRVAEFDALFASSLQSQERAAAGRLRWLFAPDVASLVHGLTARESTCCPFFTFAIAPVEGGVQVDVKVPPAHLDVLDALMDRAEAGLRSARASQLREEVAGE